jgi:hypothetical protein
MRLRRSGDGFTATGWGRPTRNGPPAAQDAEGPFTRLWLRRWNHRSQILVVPDFGHRKRDPFGAGPALAPTPTSRPWFDVAPPAPGGLAANGPPRLGQQPVIAPAVDGLRLGIEAVANLYQPNRLMLSVGVRHGTPRPRRGRGATGKQAHDAKPTLRPRRDDGELTRSQRHPCGLPCSPWPASLPPVPWPRPWASSIRNACSPRWSGQGPRAQRTVVTGGGDVVVVLIEVALSAAVLSTGAAVAAVGSVGPLVAATALGVEGLPAQEFAACQADQEHQGPDGRCLVDGHAVVGRPHGGAHGSPSPRQSPAVTPEPRGTSLHEGPER